MTDNSIQNADYWRNGLPIEARVGDLLSRMTVEEKARQLDMYMGSSIADKMQTQTVIAEDGVFDPAKAQAEFGDVGVGGIHDLYPRSAETSNAIQQWLRDNSRLGIPALFIEEALHGISAPGHTIFPQSIALASTWNPEIARKTGTAIAAEMRAVNINLSLSPVLDLVRDVRWGRTEETFGEDPYLIGRMAVGYVQGMQGESLATDHTIVAEPKHFAGHGAPEAGLNAGPVHVGKREFQSQFLAGFRAAFVEAGAMGVMAAYHDLDGIPCAANSELLTDLLRGEWGFEGIVITDLGAIHRLETQHDMAKDPADAIRQALTAGIDMQFYDYSHEIFQGSIIQSVADGSLPVEILDRAVARVLRLKFRLGLFDNPFIDPDLKSKVNLCESHLDTALQSAREAICLLKNDGNLLPLRKDLRSVAVIGPSAAHACLGDYCQPGNRKMETLLDGINAAVSEETKVVHINGMGGANLQPIPAKWFKRPTGGPGVHGVYYAKTGFQGGAKLHRVDTAIDFNWQIALPAEGMPPDRFSVRWEGFIVPDRTFKGQIGLGCQDRMQCWVDGELVASCWDKGEPPTMTSPFQFEAGREYAICVEYEKRGSGSVIVLGYSEEVDELAMAVEAARDADVAIVAVGDSAQTSGEGVDRSVLDLPGGQLDLVKAIHATGTPVILVLQNGRPLTITWEAENIPAIVEAWYVGERAGTAIAEVVFGDYNPAGRLPITFPKSVGQIPIYYNHKPSQRGRYIEIDHEPLYPFGFGLSYTTFAYDNLVVTPSEITPEGSVTINVDIHNTGNRAGDEVAQLYLRDVVGSVTTPVRQLKRFSRIHLQPGESRTVTFDLAPTDLALLDRSFNWIVEPGTFQIFVGGSSVGGLEGTFEVKTE